MTSNHQVPFPAPCPICEQPLDRGCHGGRFCSPPTKHSGDDHAKELITFLFVYALGMAAVAAAIIGCNALIKWAV